MEKVYKLPEQTGVVPEIAIGVIGVASAVIERHCAALVAQGEEEVTQMLPEVELAVAFIDVEPCPELIDHPDGTVQL